MCTAHVPHVLCDPAVRGDLRCCIPRNPIIHHHHTVLQHECNFALQLQQSVKVQVYGPIWRASQHSVIRECCCILLNPVIHHHNTIQGQQCMFTQLGCMHLGVIVTCAKPFTETNQALQSRQVPVTLAQQKRTAITLATQVALNNCKRVAQVEIRGQEQYLCHVQNVGKCCVVTHDQQWRIGAWLNPKQGSMIATPSQTRTCNKNESG